MINLKLFDTIMKNYPDERIWYIMENKDYYILGKSPKTNPVVRPAGSMNDGTWLVNQLLIDKHTMDVIRTFGGMKDGMWMVDNDFKCVYNIRDKRCQERLSNQPTAFFSACGEKCSRWSCILSVNIVCFMCSFVLVPLLCRLQNKRSGYHEN